MFTGRMVVFIWSHFEVYALFFVHLLSGYVMAGMPELRRRTHSRSNPSGNDDTAYYPQDDNHGFFAKVAKNFLNIR